MGEKISYEATGFFSVEDLKHLFKSASVLFPEILDSNEQLSINAQLEPKQLSLIHGIKGLNLESLTLTGYLSLEDKSIDSFEVILKKCEAMTRGDCYLILAVGFEEKNSKQTQNEFDRVSIRVDGGQKYFTYYPSGSKSHKNQAYRKKVILSLINLLNLPLRMNEKNSFFFLEHTTSGELKILRGGPGGENPVAFQCEILETSISKLVDKIRVFLSEFASSKRFEYTWATSCWDFSDSDSTERFYNTVVALNLPAQRYLVDIDYLIDDIIGVEALKPLLGPQDAIITDYFGFRLSDSGYLGNVFILTTFEGHKVQIDLSDSNARTDVENQLGLKLQNLE